MRRAKSIVSRLQSALKQSAQGPRVRAEASERLRPVGAFGSNPGQLDAFAFIPEVPPSGLVVVLHGCTQSAAVYDQGSGWSALGERHGFAVLYPQQRRSNNANLCFNWFEPANARRGSGEAESIRQMVAKLKGDLGLDRSNVFITGLSAGGAMTAVMLASHPELFGGGAIIAGLPFASANSLPEALARMRGQGSPTRARLSALARAGSDDAMPPPTVSVWHGTHDTLVVPDNATAIVDQWRDLHGIGEAEGRVDTVAGHRRTAWTDPEGREAVVRYDIRGMGHGTPLHTRDGEACGQSGAHMLETTICSTREIARSWGLVGKVAARPANDARPAPSPVAAQALTPTPAPAPAAAEPSPVPPIRPSGPGAVIEDALRKAGLMR